MKMNRWISGLGLLLLVAQGCIIVDDSSSSGGTVGTGGGGGTGTSDVLFYEPGCLESLDCEVGATCFDVSYDNGSYIGYDTMCTDYCAFDSDCPGLGICESIDGSAVLCWDTCVTSSDCYAGWGCWMLTTGDWTCLPE
ncbi:MAG: hypothetical protein OEY14_01705 [Myxococcales bacterium]|nr:hypothetical protein [Myxococcales bacterium]